MIRDATTADAVAIAALFLPYVRDTVITFEYDEVPADTMAQRIESVQALEYPWLVLEVDGKVAGFAYASPYRPKAAYLHSVETSIYLADHACGQGEGRRLYQALTDRLKASPAHSAISLIALPNERSVALHRSMGWREVGVLREAGYKLDRWIDVAYFQLDVSTHSPGASAL